MMSGQNDAPVNPERSVIGVIDQLLVGLTDKVVDVQTDVKENTTQIKLMESSVVLVRQIPDKMAALSEQVAAGQKEVALLRSWVTTLYNTVNASLNEPKLLEAKMQSLQDGLNKHAGLFDRPIKKEVHHKHFLAWPVAIIFALVVFSTVISAMLIDARHDAARNAESGIKWRGVMVDQDSVLKAKLAAVDSAYNKDPDQYRKDTQQEEERVQALGLRLEQVRELREQAKKP